MQDDPTLEELRRLQPAGASFDAVTLAYAAGRRSARAATRRWRGVAGVAVVCAALAAFWPRPVAPPVRMPDPSVVAVITPPDDRPEAAPRPLPDGPTVAFLQQRIMAFGVDGLPAARTGGLSAPACAGGFTIGGGL